LYRKFRTFFVTFSISLVRFDRLFEFLIFLQFTLKMLATAIETCWWWTVCDKHIIHMCIAGRIM